MSRNEKRVPKRRFREFENAGEWEQRKFDEEVEFYSGLTYSPKDISDNGTFVLRSSNVKNGEIVDADNVYVNSEVVNSSNVKEGDIIVVVRNGSRSLIGKHAQVKRRMDKTVIGAFMTGIRSNQSNFINALMDTKQFSGEVEKNLGATINQITNGMFREMRFMFPEIEEQKRIGDFFQNIDNRIELHQRKLEKMKALKKAYLTDMFPAEGERTPKLRFAGFTEDWEQHMFCNDIISIKTGTNQLGSSTNTGTPLLKMGNIQRGFFNLDKIEYLDADEDVEKENIAFYGDFFFNTRNTLELVGKGATWTGISGKYAFNSNIARFIFKDMDTIFYNYLYNTHDMIAQVHARAMGTTSVAAVYPQSLNSLKYMVPSNEEQKLIGQFFLQLDNLITIHQRKLEKLQNIKKAYLNEMFI